MNTDTPTLNPAERLAALKLLKDGIEAAVKQATTEAADYAHQVGADRMKSPWGPVTVATRKPSIVFDEAALIMWAEDEMPQIVEKSIPATARKWLTDTRFKIDGEDVIDPTTGEIVEFATVKPGSEYLTVRLDAEAKMAAIHAIAARLEQLAEVVTAPEVEPAADVPHVYRLEQLRDGQWVEASPPGVYPQRDYAVGQLRRHRQELAASGPWRLTSAPDRNAEVWQEVVL